MIIQTSRISREGGVRRLARHLLDKLTENDSIEVLAGDRHSLFDAQALAKAKGCKYAVRHLSVSPEREMSPANLSEFLRSVDVEFNIGAERPRLVVRHVKKGRAHFHIAIAEVDPTSLRVLDCRNDFSRLEDLARRYEESHDEAVQPTRTERRQRRVEGFSDVARKRAERTTPQFDRTVLKRAIADSGIAFARELAKQGLQIAMGDKGMILVNASGTFVAAANRAVGMRRNDFSKFMEDYTHDGNYFRINANPDFSRAEHRDASAPPGALGVARGSGSHRAAPRHSGAHPRRTEPASPGVEVRRRQDRSYFPTLTSRRRREELFLHQLGKIDLDDLLRRAQELARWIMSAFEPAADRLSREIRDAKRMRKLFPPADTPSLSAPTYNPTRRSPT